jgi:hypothetical protein
MEDEEVMEDAQASETIVEELADSEGDEDVIDLD